MTDRRVRIIRFYLMLAALAVATLIWPESMIWAWPLVGMIPCPGCCGCAWFSDSFTADNLATDWDERSGTWAVSGGKLTTTSASALIVANSTLPTGLTAIHLAVDITCATTSDIGHAVIAYADDNNYWFCAVQPGATDGTITLWQRSAGTNTQRGLTNITFPFQAGDTAHVTMCVGSGVVTAIAYVSDPNDAGVVGFTSSPTLTDSQGGCGTGSGASDVSFDNFVLSEHLIDTAGCPSCGTECPCHNCQPTSTTPSSVQIEITGAANKAVPFCMTCTDWNGTWILDHVLGGTTCGGTTVPTGTGGCCLYKLTTGLPCSKGCIDLIVNFSGAGPFYFETLLASGDGKIDSWSNDADARADPVSCEFSSYGPIPSVTASPDASCNWSGSSLTVTDVSA